MSLLLCFLDQLDPKAHHSGFSVLHIDASLDWMHLEAGQVLYRQGDDADSIYIVINGRLRALKESEGGSVVDTVAEHGQGESVGSVLVARTSYSLIGGVLTSYTLQRARRDHLLP